MPKTRESHPPSLKAEVAVKAQSSYGSLLPGWRAMRLRRCDSLTARGLCSGITSKVRLKVN